MLNKYFNADYLKKKSTGFFGGWDKRWFCFLNNGRKLIYYHKKPIDTNSKVKGLILMT